MNDQLKKFIKEEIQAVLKELDDVDEPEGGPFDKVAFGQDRIGSVRKEPNNSKEQQIFSAIISHYRSGDESANRELHKHFNTLYKISQKSYENILKTPDGIYVYRLTVMPVARASKLLGVSVDELKQEYMPTRKAWYIQSNKSYNSRNNLQSWTAYPQTLDTGTMGAFDDGSVAMLLEANSSNNKFLMNPAAAQQLRGLTLYKDEYEVVGKNPTKLSGIAFMVHPPAGSITPNKAKVALLDAINAKAYAKRPRKKQERVSFNT